MAQFTHEAHYECEVLESGIQESTNKNPMIVLNVRPLFRLTNYGTPDEKRHPPEAISERSVRIVFGSDKQRELNLKKLRAAGWDGTDFDGFDMSGMIIVCVNRHADGNNGKVYDNFDLPLPGFEAKEIDRSKQGTMSKKLNALLSNDLRTEKAAPKRSAPKRESVPPDSEPAAQSGNQKPEDNGGNNEPDTDVPF